MNFYTLFKFPQVYLLPSLFWSLNTNSTFIALFTVHSFIVLSSLTPVKAKGKCYMFHEDVSILIFSARTDHPIPQTYKAVYLLTNLSDCTCQHRWTCVHVLSFRILVHNSNRVPYTECATQIFLDKMNMLNLTTL